MDEEIYFRTWNGTLLPCGTPEGLPISEEYESYCREAYLSTDSIEKKAILTTIYVIMFITGVTGNLLTCIVIATNRSLHSATNFYLFNLAVSDMITLCIGIPAETYSTLQSIPWELGEPYCKTKIYLIEVTTCVSVLTISAFTAERYVAICHPMRTHHLSQPPRVAKIVAFIWFVAIAASSPWLTIAILYYFREPFLSFVVCYVITDGIFGVLTVISAVVFFLVPLIFVCTLYLLIGMKLRGSAISRLVPNATDTGAAVMMAKRRRSVIQMLIAVVSAFFVCWAPFHFQRLAFALDLNVDSPTINDVLYYTSGCLYFVSGTLNPIIYNLMSERFRKAVMRTVKYCNDRLRGRTRLTSWKYQQQQISQHSTVNRTYAERSYAQKQNSSAGHHLNANSDQKGASSVQALNESDESSVTQPTRNRLAPQSGHEDTESSQDHLLSKPHNNGNGAVDDSPVFVSSSQGISRANTPESFNVSKPAKCVTPENTDIDAFFDPSFDGSSVFFSLEV